MGAFNNNLTGWGKRRLTRADVEQKLRQVENSRELDLQGENISHGDLSHLTLSKANLSNADLSYTNLSETHLDEANLSGANLRGAVLTKAILQKAILQKADLNGAKLTGANLSKANLSNVNLSGANLSNVDLSNADLSNVNLSGANLEFANLRFVNLKFATLSKTRRIGTDFFGADLTGIHPAHIKTEILNKEQRQQRSEATTTLHIRIEEEPLTAPHLAETLDTLTSLYVKMWLLQQGRFDDFFQYTESKDRRFEEEAHLLIAELKYNSPADIKFNIDLSPKSFVESLQMLIDLIALRKHRKRAEELKLAKEQISVLDQSLETAKRIVETIAPGLDEHQKGLAIQSVLADLHKLAQDPTLDISLTIAALAPQPQYKQIVEAKQSTAQPSEQTAP